MTLYSTYHDVARKAEAPAFRAEALTEAPGQAISLLAAAAAISHGDTTVPWPCPTPTIPTPADR